MSIRRPTLLASAFVVLALITCTASGQSGQTVIPLEGLDPVMLSQGKEVQGDMKYKVTRGQFEYIFANAENKTTFEKDPARYEIQLDGHCARMGAPTTGNPDLYTVHNGRIYIFGSESCQTLFKAAPEKYLEIPAAPKSSPTAEMLKRGDELLTNAVEALGGGAKLDQLASLQIKDVHRAFTIRYAALLARPEEHHGRGAGRKMSLCLNRRRTLYKVSLPYQQIGETSCLKKTNN